MKFFYFLMCLLLGFTAAQGQTMTERTSVRIQKVPVGYDSQDSVTLLVAATVVAEGDTKSSLALFFWGDAQQTDYIHSGSPHANELFIGEVVQVGYYSWELVHLPEVATNNLKGIDSLLFSRVAAEATADHQKKVDYFDANLWKYY